MPPRARAVNPAGQRFGRVPVPGGYAICFLPGTEAEKMSPWMGAFDDNLEVLNKSDSDGGEWGRAATQDLIRSRIKIKSLNFMRGRTFVNKFLIIDEAQNLTPKQVKTLVTRAGRQVACWLVDQLHPQLALEEVA